MSMPSFIPVSKVADLQPGHMKWVIVHRERVLLVNVDGTFYALNSQTGTVITTISVGSTSRFATPTLFGHQVFVGTMTGVAAVTIS